MKRLLMMLIGLLVLVVLAAPALAGKPDKPGKPDKTTTTTTTPDVDCVFVDDVLQDWDGSSAHRCRWTVTDRGGSFLLRIEPKSGDPADRLLMPYLAVTDIYPHSGDHCYVATPTGWYQGPAAYIFGPFELPATGDCTEPFDVPDTDGVDSFAMTVSVQKAKGGDVQLRWLRE